MSIIKKIFEAANGTPFEFPVFFGTLFFIAAFLVGTVALVIDTYTILIRPILISWAEGL